YDPDDEIPEETVLIISAAIIKYEAARIDSLIAGATKSYLKGAKKAYSKVNQPFVSEEVKKEAEKYLKEYKKSVMDGYTTIQGKKVYWLRDRTLTERQKIFDILKDGITKGKSRDLIAQELKAYFEMQKSQAQLIAINETNYIKAQARDITYKKYGVERVLWTVGSNPCHICEELEGRIFTWDDLPYVPPIHVRCSCDLEAVLD
ncbi:MAG: minor capsid protein, partial [Methanobacterium sp.]